jgi:hypothetical protein
MIFKAEEILDFVDKYLAAMIKSSLFLLTNPKIFQNTKFCSGTHFILLT